jgi:DNA mismatch endonuclease (patch repair protein)
MTLGITRPSPARSRQMSLVRGKGNQTTERRLASLLRERRITGWRTHLGLEGRPDFVFRKERVAVFVDGCFWHGCRTCKRRIPKTNRSFWANKIRTNVKRDRLVSRRLRQAGWKVVRIWEHALVNHDAVEKRLCKALRMS